MKQRHGGKPWKIESELRIMSRRQFGAFALTFPPKSYILRQIKLGFTNEIGLFSHPITVDVPFTRSRVQGVLTKITLRYNVVCSKPCNLVDSVEFDLITHHDVQRKPEGRC